MEVFTKAEIRKIRADKLKKWNEYIQKDIRKDCDTLIKAFKDKQISSHRPIRFTFERESEAVLNCFFKAVESTEEYKKTKDEVVKKTRDVGFDPRDGNFDREEIEEYEVRVVEFT